MVSDPDRLSETARAAFQAPDNTIYLSSVSAWEIAVKHALGKLKLRDEPRVFIASGRKKHGIETLSLEEDAVLKVAQLPDVHKDPFDRMLICQAIAGGLILVTSDPLISRYPVRVLW